MRRPARLLAYALALALALSTTACSSNTGTLTVSVVTAPDSDVMDQVTLARLTLSDPPAVVETSRNAQGQLILDLDVPAESVPGVLTFEGFDASGALVAFGRSAPLPIAGVTAQVALYVARPLSMAAAPVELEPPRTAMGTALLPYGVLLAGGRTSTGVTGEITLYSVYTHALQDGEPLPEGEERAAPAMAAGSFGVAYLFGGQGPDGTVQDELYGINADALANVPPVRLSTEGQGLARAGAHMAPLGDELFVVTGNPLVLIDGLGSPIQATAFPDMPRVEGTATTALVSGAAYTLFAGAGNGQSGAMLLAGGQLGPLDPPAEVRAELQRTEHASTVLPDGSILVVGGGLVAPDSQDELVLPGRAIRFWPVERRFELVELLATPRRGAAVAATDDLLVIAGGLDAAGMVVGDVEVFDALTLERVATLPLVVPRQGAAAAPLANGQVLIAGGQDAQGAAVAMLELFTPGP